jgi:riboflavin kinase/FMN adenylyltransferase
VAVSVGVRPTFGRCLRPLTEAYLLDFEGDLCGKTVKIELLALLRREMASDGVEELVAQTCADVDPVRAFGR